MANTHIEFTLVLPLVTLHPIIPHPLTVDLVPDFVTTSLTQLAYIFDSLNYNSWESRFNDSQTQNMVYHLITP